MEHPDDKLLNCVKCQQPFEWSVGEQLYYLRNSLAEPKQCKKCRTVSKGRVQVTRLDQPDNSLKRFDKLIDRLDKLKEARDLIDEVLEQENR